MLLGKQSIKKLIYLLSRDKAIELINYIKENKAKSFIQKSSLLIKYLILFILK